MFSALKAGEAELIVKRSRFIAVARTIEKRDDVKDFVAEFKKEHRESRHVCYAFIADEKGLEFGYDDDGEPSGTAGKPIYQALQSFEVKKSAIAVVRYFGGIKLGAGGLTHAYRDAATAVVDKCGIVTLEKYTLLRVAQRIPRVLLHVYSLTLVVAGWGLFYFEDFAAMHAFFAAICGLTGDAADFAARSALTDSFWLWVAALLCCLPLRRAAATLADCLPGGRLLRAPAAVLAARLVLSVALLAASTALLVGATNNAFIYTRF